MEWTQRCEVAPWPARSQAGLVALPGGELVLLGGLVGPRSDVWRSKDNGTTWERAVEVAPWPARCGHGVATLAGGAMLLLAGSGGAGRKYADVWRSVDVGATWHRLTQVAPWAPRSGHNVVVLPGGVVLLMAGSGPSDELLNDVWRSPDGGTSWEQLCEAAPWPARAFGRATHLWQGGSSAVLVLGGLAIGDCLLDDVWRSDDGGVNWDLLVDGAPWKGRRGHALVALPALGKVGESDEALVLLGGLSATGTVADAWHSLDGGLTWRLLIKEAEWAARLEHSIAVLSDGSAVMTGGQASGKGGYLGDVWHGTLGEAPPKPPPPKPTQAQPRPPMPASSGGYPAPQPQPPVAPQPQPPGAPSFGPSEAEAAAEAARRQPSPPPLPPVAPPPQQKGEVVTGTLPPFKGGKPLVAPPKQESGARSSREAEPAPVGNPAWPKYEAMQAADLRKGVLELQKGLADITKRLDSVGTENQLLREENSLLKEAIDDKIEGMQ